MDTVMDEYLQALPAKHLEPLWSRMNMMVPPTPNSVARLYMWNMNTLGIPVSIDTIYGGLQHINPGETAPAHRHIAYACRYIIVGEGFAAVEGKKMPVIRGDVVVTPSWHWHDHGNESFA
ncbi:Gentisate 1,2-dioxygenase [Tolypocladium ophioglossoides CBS 100239]|uniref:Gentisate 1,2-dioxygenase n=1 Tax=Tolypocladium ophioglossoides (strain CBS 100239) TaxID=1163406 RepID=A0A0L0NC86_TOLOC|nr:Gentisate 1,2-dioxygenase [Tolypocladium ophioglossoides CBS 100239]